MSDAAPIRTHLHEAIQDIVGLDDGLPEGSVMLGWVTVVEWSAPNGQRWLSMLDGCAIPGVRAAQWQREGYLHNALFDTFSPSDDAPPGG